MSVVQKLKELGKEKVILTKKFRTFTLKKRPYLTEEYVKEWLFKFEKLVFESEKQENNTYNLIYEASGKYFLVVVIAIDGNIRIVSAWKTSKSLQKLLRKYGGGWHLKKL